MKHFFTAFALIAFSVLTNAQEANNNTSPASEIESWFVGINVHPNPNFLPYELKFTKPFTGKLQITTLEGREVLHAELEEKDSLMLPPGGLNGSYILRLLNEETGEVYLREKVVFK